MNKEYTMSQIYNEDCLITMKGFSDQFVDLIVTSPPYNMMTQTKYNKYIRRVLPTHKVNKYTTFDDSLYPDDFYKKHCEILDEMLRVSKVVLYNFQIVTGSKEAFFKIIGKYAEYIKDIIVWDKVRCLPACGENLLNNGYELILVMESNKRLGRTINNANFGRCKLDNILRIKRKKETINGIKHNASFPIELIDILVESFSKEGDIVYDPFMGTGTTGVSAVKLKRNFIGSELSEEYCRITDLRLANLDVETVTQQTLL